MLVRKADEKTNFASALSPVDQGEGVVGSLPISGDWA
jgi:hypothetical protein